MELRDVKTKIIGKNVKYFKEISSTHIYAKELVINMLDKEKNKSVVVIADKQTNGIGTKGRNWYTGSGKNIVSVGDCARETPENALFSGGGDGF